MIFSRGSTGFCVHLILTGYLIDLNSSHIELRVKRPASRILTFLGGLSWAAVSGNFHLLATLQSQSNYCLITEYDYNKVTKL